MLEFEISGFEPLKGRIKWKNFTLAEGTEVLVWFVIGSYDPITGKLIPVSYEAHDLIWAWGALGSYTAPEPEVEEELELHTYALNPPAITAYDVMVCISPAGQFSMTFGVDWGYGARIIGLILSEVEVAQILGWKVFKSALTVTPTL